MGTPYLGTSSTPEDLVTLQMLQDAVAGASASTFAASVGDGVATSFVLSHGLGTTDVTVTVYEAGGARSEVDADVEHTDRNTVTLRFDTAPALNEFRAIVVRHGVVPGGPINFVQGPAGATGARGSRIHTGVGEPTAVPGAAVGDLYIDRSTGNYYELT